MEPNRAIMRNQEKGRASARRAISFARKIEGVLIEGKVDGGPRCSYCDTAVAGVAVAGVVGWPFRGSNS